MGENGSTDELRFDRFDVGDATRRAELEEADGPRSDEPPLELVDAPVEIRPKLSRAGRKRNQRPTPT